MLTLLLTGSLLAASPAGPTGIPPLDEAWALVMVIHHKFNPPAVPDEDEGPDTVKVDGEHVIRAQRADDPELTESIIELREQDTPTVVAVVEPLKTRPAPPPPPPTKGTKKPRKPKRVVTPY